MLMTGSLSVHIKNQSQTSRCPTPNPSILPCQSVRLNFTFFRAGTRCHRPPARLTTVQPLLNPTS